MACFPSRTWATTTPTPPTSTATFLPTRQRPPIATTTAVRKVSTRPIWASVPNPCTISPWVSTSPTCGAATRRS
ncbi:hypothetical protein EVA_13611 [gut metagenome]|uniref:Uncharacterized protein n=1 Tax=gut metagenome TaxID=749906 RepID=J9G936_9ZZZZ